MAACCIGGVCIPYSAILPLLALALKWLATKLAVLGVLPDSVVERFGLQQQQTTTKSCCQENASRSINTTGAPSVRTIESTEEWNDLIQDENKVIVVKFTASWCKPCKEIAPYFSQLSSGDFDATFCQVDVDDLDEVAAQHKVAMMPTFCVIKGKQELATSRGANQANLENMVTQHVPRRA